ncbi:MAG: glycosyltransferase family 2 protein, partial [Lachnospiraceae bacterium]|nr:glycosyltransferase family 2 protein [Lachnospiraceae bacterium]
MKNNDKDVAVIVVNYNGLEDSINCIESLYSIRDSEKITIVLVDNASRRNEADIIAEKFPAAIVIKNNSNGGFSAGNNIGIEYALSNQYKYIMLLNNDTVVEEGIITKLMSHCTDVSVAVPKILYYSSCKTIWYGGGTINKITGNAEHENMGRSDNENDTKVRKCTFATGCCMMIQSDVLKKVGKLDENFFMYCEDTEFCIRLSLN